MSWFWAGVASVVIVLCVVIVLAYLYMILVLDTIARLAGRNRRRHHDSQDRPHHRQEG